MGIDWEPCETMERSPSLLLGPPATREPLLGSSKPSIHVAPISHICGPNDGGVRQNVCLDITDDYLVRSHTAATAPSKDGVQAVLDASVGRSRFPCGHRETVELHFGESNLTDKAMAKLMVTRTCEAVSMPHV